MKKKNFTALSKQIDVLLEKFSQKNSISNSLFEREVAEHKANSVSWGGYQELQYIQDFNKKMYTDVEEIITGIQSLITEINRKLNSKQLNIRDVLLCWTMKTLSFFYDNFYDKPNKVMTSYVRLCTLM